VNQLKKSTNKLRCKESVPFIHDAASWQARLIGTKKQKLQLLLSQGMAFSRKPRSLLI
jgi:hypothetical protein